MNSVALSSGSIFAGLTASLPKLERLVALLKTRQRARAKRYMAKRSALPFVGIQELTALGDGVTMLTVLKRGTLAEMISEGAKIEMPEPNWVGSVSYTEPFPKTGLFLEELRVATARTYNLGVTPDIRELVIKSGLITKASTSPYLGEEGSEHGRVANVFIGQNGKPVQFIDHVGSFTPTLYSGLYGAETRIFF